MKRNYWIWVGLVAFTSLLYLPGLSGDFVYDDVPHIQENKGLHQIQSLKDILLNGSRQQRVLLNLSLAMNWAVSPGEAWSFKLFNLLLHFLNSWLLFRILQHLYRGRDRLVYFTTGLFLVHPLQIQSVTYVMGRISLLQAFFYFGVMLYVIRRPQWKALPVSALLFLSCFAKDTCILLPIVIVAIDLLVHKKSWRDLGLSKYLCLTGTVLTCIPVYYALMSDNDMLSVGFQLYSFWRYLLFQGYYYLFYLALFFLPLDQSVVHPYPVPFAENFWIFYVGGVLGWSLVLGFTLWIFRNRRQNPVAVVWWVFFLVSMIPTNGPLQMLNPFAEYRLYQSNAVIALLFCYGLLQLLAFMEKRLHQSVIVGLLIAYFGGFTMYQSHRWTKWLWINQDAVRIYPWAPALWGNISVQYQKQEMLPEALEASLTSLMEVQRAHMSFEYQQTYLLQVAYLLYMNKKPKEAIDILDRLRVQTFTNPEDVTIYQRVRFMVYYDLGLEILKSRMLEEKRGNSDWARLFSQISAYYSEVERSYALALVILDAIPLDKFEQGQRPIELVKLKLRVLKELKLNARYAQLQVDYKKWFGISYLEKSTSGP